MTTPEPQLKPYEFEPQTDCESGESSDSSQSENTGDNSSSNDSEADVRQCLCNKCDYTHAQNGRVQLLS